MNAIAVKELVVAVTFADEGWTLRTLTPLAGYLSPGWPIAAFHRVNPSHRRETVIAAVVPSPAIPCEPLQSAGIPDKHRSCNVPLPLDDCPMVSRPIPTHSPCFLAFSTIGRLSHDWTAVQTPFRTVPRARGPPPHPPEPWNPRTAAPCDPSSGAAPSTPSPAPSGRWRRHAAPVDAAPSTPCRTAAHFRPGPCAATPSHPTAAPPATAPCGDPRPSPLIATQLL